MYKCLYCQKEFRNAGGLGSHHPYCKQNPVRVKRVKSPNAHKRKGSAAWNKGLTTPQEVRDKISQSLIGVSTGKGSTPEIEAERIRKVTEKAKLHNGGHRQGSGRGKKGWYKGFFCDSSYELAYVIYCLEHNIMLHRNNELRPYEWEGKIRNYIPDFIVNGVEVVEIKGYKTKQWEAKMKAHPDIKVLYEKDLQEVFAYVKEKYGKDFIRLYE